MENQERVDSGDVVMKGTLQLKAGFVMFGSRWRACSGQVTPTNFVLRRWSKGKTQMQRIAIEAIDEIHVTPSHSVKRPSTEFEISTRYKTLHLRASSEGELNSWISAINEAQKLRSQAERHRSIPHDEVLTFDPDPDSQVYHRVHGGFTKLGPIHGGVFRLPTKKGRHRPSVPVKKILIVATVGPACWSDEMLVSLIGSGVNIFRLNFSHRQPGMMEDIVPRLHAASAKAGMPIKILADLQGPKFRINDVLNGEDFYLKSGDEVDFALATSEADLCESKRITLKDTPEHRKLIAALSIGTRILIQDGKRSLKVVECPQKGILVRAKVIDGGRVKSRQGVNVPTVAIDISEMTAKDVEDSKFILGLVPPLDYIAVSFVQQAGDLAAIKQIAKKMGVDCPLIIPKIETRRALLNLDEILSNADGLMVARGDLGVEAGLGAVPKIQKELVLKCKNSGKLCIVATQMLESMIKRTIPTRAEISDVTNAVLDGADGVMLSAETAVGVNPLNAVKTLRSVSTAASKAASGIGEWCDLPKPLRPRRAPGLVVTLGPSSFDPQVIQEIISQASLDERTIFRISLSHFSVSKAMKLTKVIRQAKLRRGGKPPQVMISLQGPVYQLEDFSYQSLSFAPIQFLPITPGETIALGIGSESRPQVEAGSFRMAKGHVNLRNTSANVSLLQNLQAGTELWIESGTVKLKVAQKLNEKGYAVCRVEAGTRIKGGSFVDVKEQSQSLPAFTKQDRKDIFALLDGEIKTKNLPDIFALPSVESEDDVTAAKIAISQAIMARDTDNSEIVRVCANLERKRALDPGTLEGILATADIVLVARGSLAIQVDSSELALVTKHLVRKANDLRVPVIVGTQMLESMLKNPVPTRAEVSDVYNAVLDGADALLLNAETAVGAHPLSCVKVIREVASTAVADVLRSSMSLIETSSVLSLISTPGTKL